MGTPYTLYFYYSAGSIPRQGKRISSLFHNPTSETVTKKRSDVPLIAQSDYLSRSFPVPCRKWLSNNPGFDGASAQRLLLSIGLTGADNTNSDCR